MGVSRVTTSTPVLQTTTSNTKRSKVTTSNHTRSKEGINSVHSKEIINNIEEEDEPIYCEIGKGDSPIKNNVIRRQPPDVTRSRFEARRCGGDYSNKTNFVANYGVTQVRPRGLENHPRGIDGVERGFGVEGRPRGLGRRAVTQLEFSRSGLGKSGDRCGALYKPRLEASNKELHLIGNGPYCSDSEFHQPNLYVQNRSKLQQVRK